MEHKAGTAMKQFYASTNYPGQEGTDWNVQERVTKDPERHENTVGEYDLYPWPLVMSVEAKKKTPKPTMHSMGSSPIS